MTVIADTGYVVAVAIDTDRKHTACLAVHRQQPTILLPQSVLAEVAFMLTRAGGKNATIQFFRALPQSKYRPVALRPEDFVRAADILRKYQDTRVDFVDATIAAIAERLHIQTILTLDQRDFGLIRPAHVDFFELLPSV